MEQTSTRRISDKEYLWQFIRTAKRLRVPLSGVLSLTHRCNLRCVHCYLGSDGNNPPEHARELSTDRWRSIIDEVTGAGCLYLLMTGGEPLTRQDFIGLYRHARTRGLLVSVFTNATLVTDEIAETFVDCPPWAVEVSLYGVTAATHDSITGMPSSHARCMRGIELLLGRGVKVKLKTVLMMLNRHELTGMKALARRLGVKFRFDPGIFPRFSGDRGPLALRVPPEEAVDREMEDDEQRATWRAYFEKRKYLPVSDRVYSCGAGLTHFHIDPNGTLQPCSMTPHVSYPLSGDDFAEGWDGIIPALREKRTGEAYLCNRCDKRVLCGFCPAFSRLENDSEVLRSEYLCAIGQLRFKAIEQGAPAATSYGAF